jgi:hypothetical protein
VVPRKKQKNVDEIVEDQDENASISQQYASQSFKNVPEVIDDELQ